WLTFARSSRPRPVSTEWVSKEPPMGRDYRGPRLRHRRGARTGLIRAVRLVGAAWGLLGPCNAARLHPPLGVALSVSLPQGLHRSVAQLARARVSKTGGWGFESLHSCQPPPSVIVEPSSPSCT